MRLNLAGIDTVNSPETQVPELEPQAPEPRAGRTAAAVSLPPRRTLRAVGPRPQLHVCLSVEHRAIAEMLSDREWDILMALGKGWSESAMRHRLKLTKDQVRWCLAGLKERTRMSRLSLSVMGYMLSGQCAPEADEQKAA
jgi:hypothetical protein